jgi:hypothetical protein
MLSGARKGMRCAGCPQCPQCPSHKLSATDLLIANDSAISTNQSTYTLHEAEYPHFD